jgi:hypothetical protein
LLAACSGALLAGQIEAADLVPGLIVLARQTEQDWASPTDMSLEHRLVGHSGSSVGAPRQRAARTADTESAQGAAMAKL